MYYYTQKYAVYIHKYNIRTVGRVLALEFYTKSTTVAIVIEFIYSFHVLHFLWEEGIEFAMYS